jgi:hypothetical protein
MAGAREILATLRKTRSLHEQDITRIPKELAE